MMSHNKSHKARFFRFLKWGIVAVCIAALLVFIPFLIMWIAGWNPPTSWPPVSGGTIKEQTWISFSGGYVGAIIGAVSALLIMFMTLREGRSEKVENRKYAEYLHLRDLLDECFASEDAFNAKISETFVKMFDFCGPDFSMPDLKELKAEYLKSPANFRRLRRAMKQSILEVPKERIKSITGHWVTIREIEASFIEFVDKVLGNGIEAFLPEWPMKWPEYMEIVYKSLISDVESGHYNAAIDEDLMKYSFAQWLLDVQWKEDDKKLKVSPKQRFSDIYEKAIHNYAKWHSDAVKAYQDDLEPLLEELKGDLILD